MGTAIMLFPNNEVQNIMSNTEQNTNTSPTTTTTTAVSRLVQLQAKYGTPSEIYRRYGNWSASFRALLADGCTRGEISKLTGKIYQQVRNSLLQPVKNTNTNVTVAQPMQTASPIVDTIVQESMEAVNEMSEPSQESQQEEPSTTEEQKHEQEQKHGKRHSRNK